MRIERVTFGAVVRLISMPTSLAPPGNDRSSSAPSWVAQKWA